MASTDVLHQRLLVAASLLDTAAGEVRDVPLLPVEDNIHHIGNALAEIYELLRAIYAVRPDLVPAKLYERKSDSAANARLTPALSEAYQLIQEGKIDQAIVTLKEYSDAEPSELHKGIALAEITHFQDYGNS